MPPPGLNHDTIQHHSALVSHCKRKCGNVEDWNKLVVSQSLMLHILYYHVSSVAFHSISPMCLFVIKQSNIIHHEQHHLQPRNQQYLDYDCVGSYCSTLCCDKLHWYSIYYWWVHSWYIVRPRPPLNLLLLCFLCAFNNYQIYIHLLQENKHLGAENI